MVFQISIYQGKKYLLRFFHRISNDSSETCVKTSLISWEKKQQFVSKLINLFIKKNNKIPNNQHHSRIGECGHDWYTFPLMNFNQIKK